MNINDFDFTTEAKAPSAIGMTGYQFYYGSIDGVEVGSPCDSAEESIAQVKAMLSQTEPYTLEAYLSEDLAYLQSVLTDSGNPKAKEQIKLKQPLLDKLKKFNATH